MKHDQHGFSVVEILLIVAVVGICGFVGWRAWMANKPAEKTTTQTSAAKTQTTTTPKTEETFPGGKEFKSKLGGFTIKYPADWTIDSVPATQYVNASTPDEKFIIKSKSGVEVWYVLTEDDPGLTISDDQVMRNSCGAQSACDLYIVDSIEKVTFNKVGEVQLLRMGTDKAMQDGRNQADPGYSMALIKPESAEANLKVGTNNLGTSMLRFSLPGKGKDTLLFSVKFPEASNSKTAAEVFGSADAKVAEQILKSIKFE